MRFKSIIRSFIFIIVLYYSLQSETTTGLLMEEAIIQLGLVHAITVDVYCNTAGASENVLLNVKDRFLKQQNRHFFVFGGSDESTTTFKTFFFCSFRVNNNKKRQNMQCRNREQKKSIVQFVAQFAIFKVHQLELHFFQQLFFFFNGRY